MELVTWQANVQDDDGNAVPEPVVTVRDAVSGEPLSVIYNMDGDAISNPITGTLGGFVQFQVLPGKYIIEGAKGGSSTDTWFFDALNIDWTQPFPNRAAAIDADIPAPIVKISVRAPGGNNIAFRDDSAGTALSTNGGSRNWSPDGDVTPLHWGGGGSDRVLNTAALQAAIDFLADGGGEVFIPVPEYETDGEVVLGNSGVSLVGFGTGVFFNNTTPEENMPCRIVGFHEAGAVIRIMAPHCKLENIVVDAGGDRLTASLDNTAANYNAGIRVEAPDATGSVIPNVMATTLRNVSAIRQPNDGIIFIGRCYQSNVENCFCRENGNAGFVVDAGQRTSRVNTFSAGVMSLTNVYCWQNKGHGFVAGNPDPGNDAVVRLVLNNLESNNNEVDPALSYNDADAFISADNVTGISCAFGGKSPTGVSQHHSALSLAGRNIEISNTRFLDASRCVQITTHDSRQTRGVRLLNNSVRDSDGRFAQIETGNIRGVEITMQDLVSNTSIANRLPPDSSFTRGDTTETSRIIKGLTYNSGSVTIPNNRAAILRLDITGTSPAASWGMLLISSPTAFGGPAIYAFRVGSSNYCQTVAGGNNEAATGVLSGTTGTDGVTTVSTHTDGNIYIENRTSATRTYGFTFISMVAGRLAVDSFENGTELVPV
jgi:hypothetical protein